MAYTSINKPSDYFNTKLHTGTGAEATITGVGFQPDLVWSKSRNNVESNTLIDGVRGAGNALSTDVTSAEATGETQMLKSFNSDGFVTGFNGQWNASGYTYVYWNWLAGGTAVTNTDGDITSQVSANPTSGFSIVTWTGDGVGNKVGIGLTNPNTLGLAIVKKRSTTSEWQVGGGYSTTPRNFAYHLELNSTSSISGASPYMMGTQTSTNDGKLRLSTEGYVNGVNYVAYIWQSIKGFSKIGSYTGNNSTNGPFIYCGFKPAFVLIKSTNAAQWWTLLDNKRDSYNQSSLGISPNSSNSESTFNTDRGPHYMDFVSNGFKIRTDNSGICGTNSFIYMAFAESPFTTSTGIPTTAR